MIVTAFLTFIAGVIITIISPLPVISTPTDFYSTALDVITPYTGSVGFFLPLDILGACITVILAFYTLILVMSVINWMLRRVPGQS